MVPSSLAVLQSLRIYDGKVRSLYFHGMLPPGLAHREFVNHLNLQENVPHIKLGIQLEYQDSLCFIKDRKSTQTEFQYMQIMKLNFPIHCIDPYSDSVYKFKCLSDVCLMSVPSVLLFIDM